MPEFIQVISCEPRNLDIGDDMTSDGLSRFLRAMGKKSPSREVTVLFREAHDWVCFTAMTLRRGKVEQHAVTLAEKSKPAPEVIVEIDIDRDRFKDLFKTVSGREHYVKQPDGKAIRLPFEYRSAGAACEALAIVAHHMVSKEARFTVEIGGVLFEAMLRRKKGATLEPLRLVTSSTLPEVKAMVEEASAGGETITRDCPTTDKWLAPEADEARPLTSGSLEARKDAAYRIVYPSVQRGSFFSTGGPIASVENFEALVAALQAPENASDEAADVRSAIYKLLMPATPKRSAAAKLMAERIADEPDDVRAVMYQEIARATKSATAASALVRGFKEEPDGAARTKLGESVWRHEKALELLIRSELVPHWKKDNAWCRRIIALVKTEMLAVPRAWLEDAPADLIEVLGPRVQTEKPVIDLDDD